ncbi:MAG: NUDIX hydrolase [Oscillospiraceae bacterium]|nr:NUDIX hydrolase [Oscillospiraceae bacterium]
MDLTEHTLARQEIFSGVVFSVHKDEVRLPDGNMTSREVVGHPGGVVIAPLDENNELIFVRQYRYALGQTVLELPAGKLEKGEDPLAAGLRELKEETGCTAARTLDLGKFYPTPGYCSEVIHIFAAFELTQGKQQLDAGEFVELVRIPLKTAVEMVHRGEIVDGKTQVGVLKLGRML